MDISHPYFIDAIDLDYFSKLNAKSSRNVYEALNALKCTKRLDLRYAQFSNTHVQYFVNTNHGRILIQASKILRVWSLKFPLIRPFG